ncbi:hypothetical protein [Enterococcus sp. LJL51]|uniref:hypothetical protein n=1 Tax=Enterococcus sp. LJL51 TaxID=3416656 RepID=UPI003CF1DDD7
MDLAWLFHKRTKSFWLLIVLFLSTIVTGLIFLIVRFPADFIMQSSSADFYAWYRMVIFDYVKLGKNKFIKDLSRRPYIINPLIVGNLVSLYRSGFIDYSGVVIHFISFVVGVILSVIALKMLSKDL